MSRPFAVVKEFLESCLAHAPDRSADAAIPEWFAMRTHQGNVRSENQDRAVMARWQDDGQTAWVLAVADGIGGGSEGGAAAATALSAFIADLLEFSDVSLPTHVERASRRANQTVHERWRGKEGSTLSAVGVRGEQRAWVNVGDSRIYGIDAQGGVSQLTQDDSLPLGRGLVQFIGIGQGLVPHVGLISPTHHLALITTDGVHQYVDLLLPALARTAQRNSSALVDRMVHIALWCGGEDNATTAVGLLDSSQEGSQAACDVWTPGQHHRLVLGCLDAPNATASVSGSRKSTKPRRTTPKRGNSPAASRSKSEPATVASTTTSPPPSDSEAPPNDPSTHPDKRPDLQVTLEPITPGQDSPSSKQSDS
ncbi:PP2C family protein-serine/threonine phosphatase [Thiocapsa imhoffii]|nr:protein phosphatase 2C domain-containing protein [Thiocapsa imhoffii]